MIYNDNTLKELSQKQLKEHETKLSKDLLTYIDYWNNTKTDNEDWAWKVSVNVECLKQVRKYLIR